MDYRSINRELFIGRISQSKLLIMIINIIITNKKKNQPTLIVFFALD